MQKSDSITRRGFVGGYGLGLVDARAHTGVGAGADGAVAPITGSRLSGSSDAGAWGGAPGSRLVGDRDAGAGGVLTGPRAPRRGKEVVEANYAVSQPGGTYSGARRSTTTASAAGARTSTRC